MIFDDVRRMRPLDPWAREPGQGQGVDTLSLSERSLSVMPL
jgi:hypothetical protein